MLFVKNKIYILLFLIYNIVPIALSAPISKSVDAIAVRDVISPPAIGEADNLISKIGIFRKITERDAALDAHLSKRFISRTRTRTIEAFLKKAVGSLPAGTRWVWTIAYKYVGEGPGAGHLEGSLQSGPGDFSFKRFLIDHIFKTSIDAEVELYCNVAYEKTKEAFQLDIGYSEDFYPQGATIEGYVRAGLSYAVAGVSGVRYLSQDEFGYDLTG